MNKTKFITVRLDEDLYKEFKDYVNKHFLNGTGIIRNLIQNWVYNNTSNNFELSRSKSVKLVCLSILDGVILITLFFLF